MPEQTLTKPHVMVVEDDESLADWIGDYLLDNGFDISLCNRGDETVNLIRIDYPDIVILDISRSVYLEQQPVDLTSHEFNLLWLLTEHAGKVLSRDEIVSQMRGIEYDGFNRSVDILISRLRKKLNDNSSKPSKIKTVWGKGYVLATDAW